jgi:hypothetical protein
MIKFRFKDKTQMSKKLPLLIILFLIIQFSYSQPSLVTVNIKPDSSLTSGNVVFRCTISNPTKKNYGYFNFYSDCKNRIYPTFWQIVIKKDSINYMDCSLSYGLVHWIKDPDVKLYKNSVRTFDFCLNFKKLSTGSEFPDLLKKLKPIDDAKQIIKAYNNESYGNYEVQIIYLKDPYDTKNPLSLISNWTKVEYIHN